MADAATVEESDATFDFVITLAPAATGLVLVDFQTADGTAASGADYVAKSGTLQFQAGDATKTVAVPIVDDSDFEGAETLTLILRNVSGATLSRATATGTITSGDPGARGR